MIRNPYEIYGGLGPLRVNTTDEDVYTSLPHYSGPDYVPASLVSSMIARGRQGRGQLSPRVYIDPWDLENLAYLERSRESERTDCETTTEDNYNSEEGCQSTASSQFYYRGVAPEQDSYIHLHQSRKQAEPYACDGSCNNSPLFENIYEKRPQLQFPQPPPYDYYDFDPYESDAQTVVECQECSLAVDRKEYQYPSMDIYQPIYSTNTPPHFSLGKNGLLQIDYSLNWNCLDMDFNFRNLHL